MVPPSAFDRKRLNVQRPITDLESGPRHLVSAAFNPQPMDQRAINPTGIRANSCEIVAKIVTI